MKKKIFSLIMVLCIMLLLSVSVFAANSSAATALPKIIDVSTSVKWSATTKDGESITQDTFKGKIQFLIFFGIEGTCIYCNNTMKSLAENDLVNNSDVQFIAIGVPKVTGPGSAELLNTYLSEHPDAISDKIIYAWMPGNATTFNYAKAAGTTGGQFAVNVVLGTNGNLRCFWTGDYKADYYASVFEFLEDERVAATPLTLSMFTVDTTAETYDGTAKTKKITSSSLTLNTDYIVNYSNNTNAGTAAIIITGIGSYSDTLTCTFTIEKAPRMISAAAASMKICIGQTPSQIQIKDNAADESPAYTYSSSDSSVATVSSDGLVSGVAAGDATITVYASATANYNAGSISIPVKILPLQALAFPETAVEKTYGDDTFTIAAVNESENGGSITYTSDNLSVASVDASSGKVTIISAGETTITATAAEVENMYAKTDAGYTLTVAKKEITVKADNKVMACTGIIPQLTATVPALVGKDTIEDLGLALTTTATSTPAVGTYAITGTGTSDNYIVTVTPGTLTVAERLIYFGDTGCDDDNALFLAAAYRGSRMLQAVKAIKNDDGSMTAAAFTSDTLAQMDHSKLFALDADSLIPLCPSL